MDVLDVDNSALAASDIFFEFGERTRLKSKAAGAIVGYAHTLDMSMKVGDWSGIYEQLTQLKAVLDGIGSLEWRRFFWGRVEDTPMYGAALRGLASKGWDLTLLVENNGEGMGQLMSWKEHPTVERREELQAVEVNGNGGGGSFYP